MNPLERFFAPDATRVAQRVQQTLDYSYRWFPSTSVTVEAVRNFFADALQHSRELSLEALFHRHMKEISKAENERHNKYCEARNTLIRSGWVLKVDGTWRQPQPKRGLYERDHVNVISDFVNSEGLRYYVIEYAQLPGRPFIIRDHQLSIDMEIS